MRIEILRSVMVSGEPVSAGSILEATPADANLLIGMNKAQLAPEPAPEPAVEPALTSEAPKRPRKPTPTPTAEEA
jgi:hypothetical protein